MPDDTTNSDASSSDTPLRQKFDQLRGRFGSTDRLLDSIRRIPGYEKTNRSTLHRWQNTTGPHPRAAAAAELLTITSDQTLRVAIPTTLQALPVISLLWETGRIGLRPQHEFNLKLDPSWCAGGGQAVQDLRDDKVQVAFAAVEFCEGIEKEDIYRICQISQNHWSGITADGKDPRDPDLLEGREIGVHPDTALWVKLSGSDKESTSQPASGTIWFNGVAIKSRHPIKDGEQGYRWLKEDPAKRAILGWDPHLSDIEEYERDMGVERVLTRLNFPRFFLDALSVKVCFLARRSAPPEGIRLLLEAMSYNVRVLNMAQTEPGTLEDLTQVCYDNLKKATSWKLTLRSIRSALQPPAARFGLHDVNPDALLHFWRNAAYLAENAPQTSSFQ